MGWNDRDMNDGYHSEIAICPKCGKKFSYCEEKQEPGFRQKDELHCPWCGDEIAYSMDVEWTYVEKVEE